MSALSHTSWWSRSWARIKALVITESPQTFYAGVDHGRDWATAPQFPAITAEQAPSKFPYVFACSSIVSADMAGVPLQVSRGTGADSELVADHPMLALMAQPNTAEDGFIFLRQLWWDYDLNGWSVALKLRDGAGTVVSLIRLHPSRVQIRTDDFGFLSSIEYATGGPPVNYAREDILFFRRPGWLPGPAGTYGLGWIQPLQDDLKGETRVVEFNAKAFGSGTPAMFATLKDPSSPPAIGQSREDLEKRINDNLRKSHGGVHLLNGAYEITPADRVPKDMEGQQQRDWNRRSTMVVSHVPPIKVGLETANYATAREQRKEYWSYYVGGKGNGGEAAAFLGELTRLAREMSGDQSDMVTYDVSGIEELQESRTDRLTRVGQHIVYGMEVAEAYAYEGFADAPISEQVAEGGLSSGAKIQEAAAMLAQVAAGVLTPAAAIEALVSLVGLSREDATRMVGAQPVTVSEPAVLGVRTLRGMLTKAVVPRSTTAREIVWKNFAAELADPFEQRLTFRMARALRAARARYLARIREHVKSKSMRLDVELKAIDPALLTLILGSQEEFEALLEAMKPTIDAAHTASYTSTARRMRTRLAAEAELRAEAAEQSARRILVTTSDDVTLMLQADKTLADIIQDIRASTSFNVNRARTIARTEVMRALNEGATDAMVQAEIEGVELEGKMWLSARDGSPPVRDTHHDLDGEIVGIHDHFVSKSGAKALQPGGFGVAEEDINCRCGLIPVVA